MKSYLTQKNKLTTLLNENNDNSNKITKIAKPSIIPTENILFKKLVSFVIFSNINENDIPLPGLGGDIEG